MKVPILDLKREHVFLKKDIDRELKSCFKSQQWILGEKAAEFEKKTARYLGVKFAVGVASGTDALLLSLNALAIKLKGKGFFSKKDEIITTPLTFIATAEAILRSGATPVFVDIDPDTFNIGPKEIKKAVTKNTVGILPVHLYGLACDMGPIMKIAKENKLFVIEDTAQAFGGEYQGRKLGTLGDCGAFSFFPSKNLGGYGDGGLIATGDAKLAENVRVLRNHGQKTRCKADYLGYNSRLDSIQAAVLSAKLKYINKFNSLRKKVADKYNEAFGKIREVEIPLEPEGSSCAWHLYTIKVPSKSRRKLLSYLQNKGIQPRVYYPLSLAEMPAFKGAKVRGGLANTKDILSRVLSLPAHPFLNDKDIDYVIENVLAFFKR